MHHYKDKNPTSTIRAIKGILSRLGIRLSPSITYPFRRGVCSVRLRLSDTHFDIGTNGKGISRNLALASAYGEFMERLQNQRLYNTELIYRVDSDFARMSGFYHSPDEKYLTIGELVHDLPEELLHHFFSNEAGHGGVVQLKRFLANSIFKHKGKFICLPFYSFKRGEVVSLPLGFLKEANGMCAGNTPEEAIIHGICEILERHVMHEILFKGINPPTVPDKYLKKHFPEIQALIEHLEIKEGLRFIVKDCSMNGLFPVIGIIMLSRKANGYYVRFGAHPDLSIAIERAFTELFQGKSLSNFPYVHFDFLQGRERGMGKWIVWCNNLRNGQASYQENLFSDAFSYPFRAKDPPLSYKNNHECLAYLLRLLRSLDWDIMLRNVSFLEFPSYHVILPQAQLGCFDNCPYEKPDNFYYISDLLHKLQDCSKKDIDLILKYLDKKDKTGARHVFSKSLKISLSDTQKLRLFDQLLPVVLYYKIGKISEAYKHLSELIGGVSVYRENHASIYKCARDFIGMVQANLSVREIISMLKNFYTTEQLFVVINLFLNDMRGFSEFIGLPCPHCFRCGSEMLCKYPVIKKLQSRIKHAMSKNKIAQEGVGNFISGWM